MQKILVSSLLLVGFNHPLQALAQDKNPDKALVLPNMVVTSARVEEPENEVGSVMSVITAKEISAKNINNVADALRTVPGLDVVRAGGAGQQTSVFMRGANSNHTLVLVDGIEMNDPSSPTGAFDFAFLQTDNIERIEVLRGAASAIYGSDAMGGVINIITKKGAGEAKINASAEGGSYDSWTTKGGISGGTERVNYSLDASRYETTGFSSADTSLGNLTNNAYRNTTVSSRTGVKVTEELDLGMNLRYTEGKSFLDNCGDRYCDDPNSYGKFNELFSRGFGHLKLFDGVWEQTLGLAYTRNDRNNKNDFDALNNFRSLATNLGEKLKLDYQNIIHVHPSNTVTLGIDEEADRLSSAAISAYPDFAYFSSSSIPSKSMNTLGYYLQDQIKLFERSFTTVGVRYDENNRVGGRATWRVSELYTLKQFGTRLKANYGTGFKAPTLNQLYDTIYFTGNPNLKAETSDSWDVGFEQDLFGKVATTGVSYFNNNFKNLIQALSPIYQNQNISRAKVDGVETFLEIRPFADLSFRSTYTYQQTEDLDTGKELLRRPKDKASFDADYQFLDKAHAHINVLVVGQKADVDHNVPGYSVLNFATSYDVTKELQLTGRIDNVLDKHYEELYGYATSGVAGYGGIKLAY